MSKNEHLNCEQSRDQLDLLVEAMVDARIEAELNADPTSGSAGQAGQIAAEPTGALKEHLASCTDCHNYQLANRVIIEAARALPKIEADEALTQSILARIQESQESELGTQTAKSIPAATTAVTAVAAPISNGAKPFVFSLQSIYGLVASFLAFTFITSTSAGFTIDAVWSAGSWALALLMVAMLKPLIEGNGQFANATPTSAKA
jgi:hypothetical protein